MNKINASAVRRRCVQCVYGASDGPPPALAPPRGWRWLCGMSGQFWYRETSDAASWKADLYRLEHLDGKELVPPYELVGNKDHLNPAASPEKIVPWIELLSLEVNHNP